ncbi:MAG: hypothetical protein ACTHNM_18040 [Dyella sp.]|uniref:hypothetical protein n=1 Tax=Dyella sp. TaxID=1869338 RepID=UPI003F8237FA
MIRLSTLAGRLLAASLLASALVLTGCHRGVTREEVAALQAQHHFDTVIKAYKSGQFLVDGAVLSAIDTGSHFAYLKDAGKLPKTVLLVPSDDSKVRKLHLQFLARMQLDYGFTAYYDDGGELRQIDPKDVGSHQLEDYHAPQKMDDEQRARSASGGGIGDQVRGN